MSKVPENITTPGSKEETFDAWFDREIAALNADIARLEASLPRRSAITEKAQSGATSSKEYVANGMARDRVVAEARAGETVASPASTPAPAVARAAQEPIAAPAIPTGTDLADPKNFGLMPPTTSLERGTLGEDEYRQRLSRDLAFANQVLHTSRVPAAVWREWRVFEKSARERLLDLSGRRD